MKPKIVASLMPKHRMLTSDEVTQVVQNVSYFDILELRIDAIPSCDVTSVSEMMTTLKRIKSDIQVLVTYRSAQQGGKGLLDNNAYGELLEALSQVSTIDMIDVEWDFHYSDRQNLVQTIQAQDKNVVVSYHDFDKTPSIDELKKIYFHLSQMKGNYLKVAVMPNSRQDVLVLLQAISEASESLNQLVAGISMSELGIVTRIAQGTFGGALTFGALGSEAVAPGQIPVQQLIQAIQPYHLFD
ncbi:type I 3-dehydroquinate dehydratase [Staphylococcus sp. 17KM0847]|uniref:type I 3-dehydroquinate dehydratase n=1 Tax=Staphylococcus sp. 17KM0847 TaxID=2583989 RepID=UPI0015DC45B8|nr:type I 3-dehydroquinate dehydratase [Staphylococcus sp. 17KM0847]QLK85566.1 type I 3-dehydroquinate dehydratase [Staphylococcus sp. 17KM0847]